MDFWLDIGLPVLGGAIGSTITVFWTEDKRDITIFSKV